MPASLVRGKYVIARPGADADSSSVIVDGAVFQRDGVIEDVGPYDDLRLRYEPDELIGGQDFLVIPGLINAHHHGRSVTTLQLGTPDDSLETWILAGWGRRSYDQYLMTLYAAMQMIESGTTTIMYNHPQGPVATLESDIDEIMRAFKDAGVRAAFSVYFRNQNRIAYGDDEQFLASLPSDLAGAIRTRLAATSLSDDDYFQLFEAFHRKYAGDSSDRVRLLLSPSNVQWCSDEFLQRAKEYAARYNTGIHIHLVETFYQKHYGFRTWSKTPVAHLQDLGFLGPEVSCAHGVWLTAEDIRLLAQSGSSICHNVSSNLRLKSGIAPVNRLLEEGINVAMGTDSTSLNDDDDMLQEVRLVSKLHREPGIDAPAITPHQVLRMATANGAAPTFFHDQVGTLEKGRKADMVLLDLAHIQEPYLDRDMDMVEALVYRGKAQHVDTVIIGGEVILQGGRFTRLNKEDVVTGLKERFAMAPDPSLADTRQLAQRLLPYVKRFYQGWHADDSTPHYRYNSRM